MAIPGVALAAGISGASNLIGGLLQQGNSNAQAQQAEQYQDQSIASQEAYQTQMSDTAYQRSVTDMTAAGLNPALMYSSGGPESTPSGANASGVTAPQQNVLGNSISAGLSTASQLLDMNKTVADTQLVKTNTTGVSASNQEKILEGKIFNAVNKMVDRLTTGPSLSQNPVSNAVDAAFSLGTGNQSSAVQNWLYNSR